MATMNVCTSGRRINGIIETHAPCGHVLQLIGHTARRELPVEVCPRCDCPDPDDIPTVRELRAD